MKITEADAHELALDYAGLEKGRDVKITPLEDGSYIVELTSDITVYVDSEGNCSK
jgi:hypothetical protein